MKASLAQTSSRPQSNGIVGAYCNTPDKPLKGTAAMKKRVPEVQHATPFAPKQRTGWHGVPGARHIPPSDDPLFPAFAETVTDWKAAGIEMTDEIMAAALMYASSKADAVRRRSEAAAAQQARLEEVVATEPPPPGTFGDAPGGCVYYVRRLQYVKIGTTGRLRARMRDLMPDEVLAVEPGSYQLERQLHARFAASRVDPSCEYFRLTPDLQAHIACVIELHGAPPQGLAVSELLQALDRGGSSA